MNFLHVGRSYWNKSEKIFSRHLSQKREVKSLLLSLWLNFLERSPHHFTMWSVSLAHVHLGHVRLCRPYAAIDIRKNIVILGCSPIISRDFKNKIWQHWSNFKYLIFTTHTWSCMQYFYFIYIHLHLINKRQWWSLIYCDGENINID